MKKQGLPLKATIAVSFVATITVNAMSSLLPINGITPGGVSDSYPNLFAPAGIAFSVWSVIYMLLALYTLYCVGMFRSSDDPIDEMLVKKTGTVFCISNAANIAWIFSWHYNMIALSMVFMAAILACLIYINLQLCGVELSRREKLFIKIPFGVYFGWITVATIANATTLLVNIGWDGFGLPDEIWTVVLLTIGALIGIAALLRFKNIAYGVVLLWAYSGILIKHTGFFAGKYPGIITATAVCIALIATATVYTLLTLRKKATAI